MSRCGIKICGICDPESLGAALDAPVQFLGFVFHESSPRNVDFDTARTLINIMDQRGADTVQSVALLVNPENKVLDDVCERVRPSMIQLHGEESPARVADIRSLTQRPVIKALRIGSADDLKDVAAYEEAADWLLFDARIAADKDGAGQEPRGGTGHSFDWEILKGRHFKKPWMLAGGLHAGNIGAALSVLSPDAVDVSSGVERVPGVKDAGKIAAFVDAVRNV